MENQSLSMNSSAQRIRAFALGPQLIQWSNGVEPKLREKFDKLSALSDSLAEAIASDLNDLPEAFIDPEQRASELNRIAVAHERLTNSLGKMVDIHSKLTAGGAASVWAAMQRVPSAPVSEQPTERNVNTRRPLGCKAPVIEA